jgi:Skp family chaperone for outer membrane proteins
MTAYPVRTIPHAPAAPPMPLRTIASAAMLIFPWSGLAVFCGFALLAEATPGTAASNGGIVGVVGGIAISLYGLWVQDQQNRRIAENRKEIVKAKEEALEARRHALEVEAKAKTAVDALRDQNARQQREMDRQKAEAEEKFRRLSEGQQDIRGSQQEIVTAQAVMAADLKKVATPDPDHPIPIVIMNTPDHPGNVTLPRGAAP